MRSFQQARNGVQIGMATRARADQLAYAQGLADSPEQAARLIMAGQVHMLQGERQVRVDKPGQQLAPASHLFVTGRERFVSRGAYKLLTALERFSLDVTGFVVLDAGASTGGFTDCLLQHGAERVYAVDVGKHQLHERLRADSRVVSLEGVNLRLAEPGLIPEAVDMVVADVSFISLTRILPACMQWLKPGGLAVALIKPQFELPSGATEKGVVRDEAARKAAVDRVLDFARQELGLALLGVVPSAIKGPKGNQEYAAVWRRERPAVVPSG